MTCPYCKQTISGHVSVCPHCQTPLTKFKWVKLVTVFPPDDAVLESMLRSCGIPVLIERAEVPQFPITIGPLAESKLMVPAEHLQEARQLIETQLETEE
ncbi:MAG: hypothetical protein ACOX6L_04380 [Syntrophomonadaceae bacterium]|jgi:RNA polymerase subunit RPABC4/transcription elongation factor Spt4